MTIGLASPGTLRLKRSRSPCLETVTASRDAGRPASAGERAGRRRPAGGGARRSAGRGGWRRAAGARGPGRTARAPPRRAVRPGPGPDPPAFGEWMTTRDRARILLRGPLVTGPDMTRFTN